MDFGYVSELFICEYGRNAQINRGPSWNEEEKYKYNQRSVENQRSQRKENCSICQKEKKNELATYIKKKSRSDCYQRIEEEEEIDASKDDKKSASANQEK